MKTFVFKNKTFFLPFVRVAGFTLLEVMISVSILGVIMTLVWASTSQSIKAKDSTEARDMVFQMGRVTLRKLTDDLTSAFLTKQVTITGGATAEQAPTVTQSNVKTFFVGEDNGGQDTIKFTTFSHLRLFNNAKECDQSRVQYEAVSSETEPGTIDVIRREEVWLSDNADIKGKSFKILEGVKEFDVEYYDERKNEWVKGWDSMKIDWKDRMPSAVRATLVFNDPIEEGAEISISTAIILPLSEAPIEL